MLSPHRRNNSSTRPRALGVESPGAVHIRRSRSDGSTPRGDSARARSRFRQLLTDPEHRIRARSVGRGGPEAFPPADSRTTLARLADSSSGAGSRQSANAFTSSLSPPSRLSSDRIFLERLLSSSRLTSRGPRQSESPHSSKGTRRGREVPPPFELGSVPGSRIDCRRYAALVSGVSLSKAAESMSCSTMPREKRNPTSLTSS